MRRFVFALFAVTVFVACQPASIELTDNQKGEIAAEVELLHGQMWAAWNETDLDRAMSYYRNSPDIVWADDGELMKGWTTINDMVQSLTIESQAVTFNESKTTVLALDVVHVVDQGTYVVTSTDGATGPETTFATSILWVLRNGEWKLDFIHVSRLTPETP